MSFRAILTMTQEPCDKCKEPMTRERPGIDLYASCEEAPRQRIWLHIACMNKEIARVENAYLKQKELQP